jgi:hypothetical protein
MHRKIKRRAEMKNENAILPRSEDNHRGRGLKKTKIKMHKMPFSHRILALLGSVFIAGVTGFIFGTGRLGFEENPVISTVVLTLAAVLVLFILTSRLNSKLTLDAKKSTLKINFSGFRTHTYSLDRVDKIALEHGYLVVYIITDSREMKTKAGQGYIRQKYEKRESYPIPHINSSHQQRRFSHFVKECSDILLELHGEQEQYFFSGKR